MYTGTLDDRWFKGKTHENCCVSWHGDPMDNKLNFLMKKLSKMSVEGKDWDVGTANNLERRRRINETLSTNFCLEKRTDSMSKSDREVALWLAVDPFIGELNCSTSIERMVLSDGNFKLPFNITGNNRISCDKTEAAVNNNKVKSIISSFKKAN
jgi:hypothetical protein